MGRRKILSETGPGGLSKRGLQVAMMLGVIGVAGGAYLGMTQAPSRSSEERLETNEASTNTDTIEDIRLALAAEVRAREELTLRIAELESVLAGPGSIHAEASASPNASDEASSNDFIVDLSETASGTGAIDSKPGASQFDDRALLALGAHPRDVERLRERWIQHEFDKEALSNQALQEGYFQRPKHRGEMIGLELALRRDLQEEDYDRYLFALGKPNRLEAGEVLAGSSASDAGLRQGDVILRYDDVRMFGPGELLVASSSGGVGGSVALEILRDGRRRTLYVKPGPLGALVEHRRGQPIAE